MTERCASSRAGTDPIEGKLPCAAPGQVDRRLLTRKVRISRYVDVPFDDQLVRVDLETGARDPHLQAVLLLVAEPVRRLQQHLLIERSSAFGARDQLAKVVHAQVEVSGPLALWRGVAGF